MFSKIKEKSVITENKEHMLILLEEKHFILKLSLYY